MAWFTSGEKAFLTGTPANTFTYSVLIVRVILVRLVTIIIILGCSWSSLRVFPLSTVWIELTQSLGSYFLVAHCLAILMLLFLKTVQPLQRVLLVSWNCVLLIPLSIMLWHWYTPQVLPHDCPVAANRSFRALFANVHTKNSRYQDLRRQIEREQPDFVGLVEVHATWLRELSLQSEFPYSLTIPQQDNFGIALYSKHPLTFFHEGYGEEITPAIRAEVSEGALAGLRISVVHSIPPLSAAAYRHNSLLIRRIATEVRHSQNPYLLMGDFNATIFSGLFRKLFWGGEMRHAGQGRGYFTTWDAQSFLKRLMLDHVLLAGCIRTIRYERGQEFGSDHYPLVFEGLL